MFISFNKINHKVEGVMDDWINAVIKNTNNPTLHYSSPLFHNFNISLQ
jgi:hypothetical protein